MNFEPGWAAGRYSRRPFLMTAPAHGALSLACRLTRSWFKFLTITGFWSSIPKIHRDRSWFWKFDSGRAELVVSRITTTISIARQGPSAFFISAGGPALRRNSSRLVQTFRQDNYCNPKLTAKQWLAAFRNELEWKRRFWHSPASW